MSSQLPAGFGGSTSSLMRKSVLDGRAPPPDQGIDNFDGVCRPGDPQGKRSVRKNGTDGRVYSQELRADNRTPAQRAESEAKFNRALACDRSAMSRLACGKPMLDGYEITSGSVEVSGGGMSAGVEASSSGLRNTLMVPTAPGAAMGTEGVQYGIGGSPLPKVKAGLCIAKKGAKPPAVSVKAEVSGGIMGGSTNGYEHCLFAQTPSVPEATITMK